MKFSNEAVHAVNAETSFFILFGTCTNFSSVGLVFIVLLGCKAGLKF